MARRLTTLILLALVAGLVVGLALHLAIGDGGPASTATLARIATWFGYLPRVFLRLIKMIIAPLVFATLVSGIAQMGDTAALGRVGTRALAWFIAASLVSLTLGLVLVTLFHPGVGIAPPPAGDLAAGVAPVAFDMGKFLDHIVPSSMIDAMATNEILQIVVFSLFVGVAITAVGERAQPLVRAVDGLVAVMLAITDYVMRAAPLAVFGAVAAALTERGPAVIGQLALFMGSFYVALGVLWVVLILAGAAVIGAGRMRALVGFVRQPLILAFTTASSEAAYPRLLEALERFGVPNRIASFVLPLGYSFNLDGSMIYMTFASLFIAQAYGIQLSLGTQVAMLLWLMVSSKGIAGVPRASLVVIAATLPAFGVPEAGLVLVLAVDHFLDMGRTATNVVGNAVASAVVARWEGALGPIDPRPLSAPPAP